MDGLYTLKPGSRQAYVVEQLRHAILDGTLMPGQRIRQAEIASHFGFSITPVREALWALSIEGLVDSNAYNGWWVHTPTSEEMKEVYAARITLAPLFMSRAVNAVGPSELESAEQCLAKMEMHTELSDWVRLNRDFHSALESAGQSPFMLRLHRQLSSLSQIYTSLAVGLDPVKQASANRDHRALLQAFANRDVDAAAESSVKHLESALAAALEQLDSVTAADADEAEQDNQ